MKAFTLIEILVSIVIFFIVSISALNIISNSNYLINLFYENKKFNYFATIEAVEQKEVTTLYDAVLEFNLTDDEIIHSLKKEIHFQKELDSKEFNKTLSIYKIKIYDKFHSLNLYEVKQ